MLDFSTAQRRRVPRRSSGCSSTVICGCGSIIPFKPGVARSTTRTTGDGLAVVGQQSTSQRTELGLNHDFGGRNLDSIHHTNSFSRGEPALCEGRQGRSCPAFSAVPRQVLS